MLRRPGECRRGVSGMVGGQVADLEAENQTPDLEALRDSSSEDGAAVEYRPDAGGAGGLCTRRVDRVS